MSESLTDACLDAIDQESIGGHYPPPGVVRELVAEVQRLRMKEKAWTSEPPTVPGWYWWREKPTDRFSVVGVCMSPRIAYVVRSPTDCQLYLCGYERKEDGRPSVLLSSVDCGEWAGPIEPPP